MQEIFSMADLIEKFDIRRVHVASAKFSPDKLEWTNAYYINHILTEEEFTRRCIPFLVGCGLISQEYAQDESHFEFIKEAALWQKSRLKPCWMSHPKSNSLLFRPKVWITHLPICYGKTMGLQW